MNLGIYLEIVSVFRNVTEKMSMILGKLFYLLNVTEEENIMQEFWIFSFLNFL